jgi:uncharacterized protein (DUF427 family)
MKAILDGRTLAESEDVVERGGYAYFPRSAVRMDLLEPAERSAEDLRCPHGVRFYDAVVDDVRHERVAWSYEAAEQTSMRPVALRMGFWEDVEVG